MPREEERSLRTCGGGVMHAPVCGDNARSVEHNVTFCFSVSATQSPVVFIGTGEHMDDLQQFSTKSFVSKLLGMGDIEGLFQKISKVVDKDAQPKMLERIQAGEFSLRDMYEQFQNILQMGPLNQVRGDEGAEPGEMKARSRGR